MTEKKRKIPLEGFVRIPASLDKKIGQEAHDLDLFKYEVVEKAWNAYKGYSGSGQPQSIPLSLDSRGTEQNPMVDVVRPHMEDPNFLECIEALGRIWGIGIRDFKEAITSNCRAFVRASDAIKELNGITADGSTSDYKNRVGRLLGVAAAIDSSLSAVKKAPEHLRGSRKGVAGVGGKSDRKGKGGS